MTIKGLTDNVIPRFPRLGKLRKGGEKPTTGNKPGAELSYFRFTSENPAIVGAFHEAYGTQPAMLRVYLPYPSTEMNFSTWKEAWAAGGLVHRCDGETCTIWRTPDGKYSQAPKPCPGGCKEVGRLEVILPELITAGFVGYVTLETHSLHDLMNITATLEAVRQSAQDRPNGLQGIEFVLRRKKERISTPDGKGGRASREKWLVSIEPVPSWAQTYLAMASSTLAIEAPRVDMLTGEVLDDDDEEDDNGIVDSTATVTTEQPKPPAEPAYKRLPRPWPANVAIEAIRDMAAVTKNDLPDNGAWKALIGHLDSKPFDTAKRHALMREVFGVDSSKALDGHQRYALHKWASPGQVDGVWSLDGRAIAEYTAIVTAVQEQPDADQDGWGDIDANGVEVPLFT
jgi:hypothetical protein